MYMKSSDVLSICDRFAGYCRGGCNFGGNKINMPLYADDIVLVSPTSVGFEHVINNLEKIENIADFGTLK